MRYALTFSVGIIVLILMLGTTIPGSNTWYLLTVKDYTIPVESSLFTFIPTVMNPTSAEMWIYGEDHKYYYYNGGNKKIAKKLAFQCEGFNPNNYHTWCH